MRKRNRNSHQGPGIFEIAESIDRIAEKDKYAEEIWAWLDELAREDLTRWSLEILRLQICPPARPVEKKILPETHFKKGDMVRIRTLIFKVRRVRTFREGIRLVRVYDCYGLDDLVKYQNFQFRDDMDTLEAVCVATEAVKFTEEVSA